MNRYAVSVLGLYLALDKGQEVVESVGGNIALVGGYPVCGEIFFLVCGFAYVKGNYLDAVRLAAYPAEAHHSAAVAVKGTFHSGCTYLLGFVQVGKGGNVCAASLHNVQLNGTYLAAETLCAAVLKILGNARIVRMTECVRTCFHILALVGHDALGNGDDNSPVALHHSANISEKFFHIKAVGEGFGNIDKVGSRLSVGSEYAGGSGEPACVSAHYLNDGDGLDTVNTAVTDYLLESGGNVLCGGAEAGGMVCSGQVIVDGLGHADYLYVAAHCLAVAVKL